MINISKLIIGFPFRLINRFPPESGGSKLVALIYAILFGTLMYRLDLIFGV